MVAQKRVGGFGARLFCSPSWWSTATIDKSRCRVFSKRFFTSPDPRRLCAMSSSTVCVGPKSVNLTLNSDFGANDFLSAVLLFASIGLALLICDGLDGPHV